MASKRTKASAARPRAARFVKAVRDTARALVSHDAGMKLDMKTRYDKDGRARLVIQVRTISR